MSRPPLTTAIVRDALAHNHRLRLFIPLQMQEAALDAIAPEVHAHIAQALLPAQAQAGHGHPETSHDAAAKIGALQARHRRVLAEYANRWPDGFTDDEVRAHCTALWGGGWDSHTRTRRDLKNPGLIAAHPDGLKRPSNGGNPMEVLVITDAGDAYLRAHSEAAS